MPRTTSTTPWDAASFLEIRSTHASWFDCVGTNLKGERCKCQVARANVEMGMSLLNCLPQQPSEAEDLQLQLEDIASRLLCRRNSGRNFHCYNQIAITVFSSPGRHVEAGNQSTSP
ncbi:hypothetical protein DOTSEDRAFT_28055 [Dothistroma septosporum NZE10]|uniref:Uncharacterized protein n=1 Tax=Dothistroma septosporum (strain NZE10 / CBS 128990) TaxID=675120 RepID=N1PDH3_DOTSN|nr:hypothetical protein DOTSEDRAFT_28055 [Dothistroma septosporum NZE10]